MSNFQTYRNKEKIFFSALIGFSATFLKNGKKNSERMEKRGFYFGG